MALNNQYQNKASDKFIISPNEFDTDQLIDNENPPPGIQQRQRDLLNHYNDTHFNSYEEGFPKYKTTSDGFQYAKARLDRQISERPGLAHDIFLRQLHQFECQIYHLPLLIWRFNVKKPKNENEVTKLMEKFTYPLLLITTLYEKEMDILLEKDPAHFQEDNLVIKP